MLSVVVVFHNEGGSEIISVSYCFIFVLFVNGRMYVSSYEYLRFVLNVRGSMYMYVLAVLLFMTEQLQGRYEGSYW
jgi:hypothetical protein